MYLKDQVEPTLENINHSITLVKYFTPRFDLSSLRHSSLHLLVHYIPDLSAFYLNNLMTYFCRVGKINHVRALQACGVPVQAGLRIALVHGRYKVVKFLYPLAETYLTNFLGLAIQSGKLKMVQFLCFRGHLPIISATDNFKKTIQGGHRRILDFLIELKTPISKEIYEMAIHTEDLGVCSSIFRNSPPEDLWSWVVNCAIRTNNVDVLDIVTRVVPKFSGTEKRLASRKCEEKALNLLRHRYNEEIASNSNESRIHLNLIHVISFYLGLATILACLYKTAIRGNPKYF